MPLAPGRRPRGRKNSLTDEYQRSATPSRDRNVHVRGIDPEPQPVADVDPQIRREPRREARLEPGVVLAVEGVRDRDPRGVGAEVHQQVGAERLDQDDLQRELRRPGAPPPAGSRPRRRRRPSRAAPAGRPAPRRGGRDARCPARPGPGRPPVPGAPAAGSSPASR